MSRKDRRHDPEAAERVTSIIEAAERAAAALIDKADASAKRYLAEAEAEADRAAAARIQALNETAEALISQAEAIRRESARLLESLRHADVGRQDASPGPAMARPQVPDSGPGPQGRSEQAPITDLQGHSEEVPTQGDAGGARAKHLAAVPGPSPAATPDPWPGRDLDTGPPPSTAAGPAPTFAAGPIPGQPQAAPDPMPPQGDPHRSDGAAGARLLATQMAVSGYSRREIEAKLRHGFRIENPTPILDAILGPGD